MVENTISTATLEDAATGRSAEPLAPLQISALCYEAGGQRLIDDVSLRLEGGTRAIVLGPNGAGKSLLLRLCHGLLSPLSGNIHWGSKTPVEFGRAIAMVFQKPVMLRRSAEANVAYALKDSGLTKHQRNIAVEEILEATGLGHLADRQARALSGGEQQRVAIARAWALRPSVLLLDEPTSNLDPAAARAIEKLIMKVHASGTTVIMATHDLGQARRLALDIVFLHQGRLVEHSVARDFFAAPATEVASQFMAGELLC